MKSINPLCSDKIKLSWKFTLVKQRETANNEANIIDEKFKDDVNVGDILNDLFKDATKTFTSPNLMRSLLQLKTIIIRF